MAAAENATRVAAASPAAPNRVILSVMTIPLLVSVSAVFVFASNQLRHALRGPCHLNGLAHPHVSGAGARAEILPDGDDLRAVFQADEEAREHADIDGTANQARLD